jgi:hypothetical protein
MKATTEQKILEIVKRNDEMPFSMNKKAATEIDTLTKSHYLKFTEWTSINIATEFNGGSKRYVYIESTEDFATIEDVYEFWKNNINI